MKSQSLDHAASPSFPPPTRPNPAAAMQRLREKLQQRIPGKPTRIESRLNWFIGLYLASLLSFSGLVSAVRWTLELL